MIEIGQRITVVKDTSQATGECRDMTSVTQDKSMAAGMEVMSGRRQARIGIIGVGSMGADHARTLFLNSPAAIVTAISDFNTERAREIATEVGAKRVHADPIDLINDPEVNGVLIASPDDTHARLVSECLKAGKRVLCEKPLAPTPRECFDLLTMEMKTGRRLIDVGFMRRFDAGYNELRAVLRSKELGDPLMLHCIHRNPSTPPGWTSEMQITAAAVHEIDIIRWLTHSEITRVQVIMPRSRTESNIADPMLVILQTEGGIVCTISLFVQGQNGYEVSTELLCDNGSVSAGANGSVTRRVGGQSIRALDPSYRERFADAYRTELQGWAVSIADENPNTKLASAWDGYAASAVGIACIQSMQRGEAVDVEIDVKPTFY